MPVTPAAIQTLAKREFGLFGHKVSFGDVIMLKERGDAVDQPPVFVPNTGNITKLVGKALSKDFLVYVLVSLHEAAVELLTDGKATAPDGRLHFGVTGVQATDQNGNRLDGRTSIRADQIRWTVPLMLWANALGRDQAAWNLAASGFKSQNQAENKQNTAVAQAKPFDPMTSPVAELTVEVRQLTVSYPDAISAMGKLLRDIRQADASLDLQAEMVGRGALADLISGLIKMPSEKKQTKVETVSEGTKPPAPSKLEVENGAADADIPF